MITQLAHNQQEFVKRVFTFVQEKKYANAEKEVITICTKIIEGAEHIKNRSSYLLMIDVLYSEFNDYYQEWMAKQYQDANIEEGAKNIFIEHCKDPIKIEDMLWETANVLTAENKAFM